jgi:hypothetical protein
MAMPPIGNPLINGNRYDFSSIRAMVKGLTYLGFKSINYSHSLEPGEVYGTHAQKMGRTRGQYKPEASFEMYKEEYALLLTGLGPGYMERSFDIVVNYEEWDGLTQRVVTDVVAGFRIKKAENAHSSGNEPLTVKVEGSVMYVLENGLAPLNNLHR